MLNTKMTRGGPDSELEPSAEVVGAAVPAYVHERAKLIHLFPPLQNDDIIGGHGYEDPALK